MSGLLRRLTRRGPATADENRSPATESSDPAAAPVETPAEPGGRSPTSGEPDARPSPGAIWAGAAGGQASPAPSTEPSPGGAESPASDDASTGRSAAPAGPAATAGEQATTVLPATGEQPLPAWSIAATQPTAFAAQTAPPRDLPAGVDPGDLAAAPAASARRGKLRRRLRYLRHVRELLLRDLGGFTYEVHRTAGGTAQEPHRRLAAAKAERIAKLDEEVLALEARLGEPHAEALLREPGIGGTCPECGELHASDAHFCSRCGAPLDEKARAQRAAAPAAPTTGSHTAAEPQPASVLWAGGPRPAPEPAPEAEQAPSELTSRWLTTEQPTTFSRAAQPEERATTADEPAEPPAADQAGREEPAATTEPPMADEPAAAAEPPTADEPAPAAEPPTADEPALDEPATAVEVPNAADEEPAPARPKRVAKPRKRAPSKPKAEPPAFEPNGRREDDVSPPVGDPVASPREPGS
jgi:hypothetical protein